MINAHLVNDLLFSHLRHFNLEIICYTNMIMLYLNCKKIYIYNSDLTDRAPDGVYLWGDYEIVFVISIQKQQLLRRIRPS